MNGASEINGGGAPLMFRSPFITAVCDERARMVTTALLLGYFPGTLL